MKRNIYYMKKQRYWIFLPLCKWVGATRFWLIRSTWCQVTDVELIPGGRNIRVSEENKHEYVDLNAEHKLTTAIRPQINAFLEGFNELVNRDLISIFNDKELELLISGLPEIDCKIRYMNWLVILLRVYLNLIFKPLPLQWMIWKQIPSILGSQLPPLLYSGSGRLCVNLARKTWLDCYNSSQEHLGDFRYFIHCYYYDLATSLDFNRKDDGMPLYEP